MKKYLPRLYNSFWAPQTKRAFFSIIFTISASFEVAYATDIKTDIDAYDISNNLSLMAEPESFSHPELIACIDNDSDVPNEEDKEFCCPTVTGEKLCWKAGPKKTDDIPHYFELLEDYVIPTERYFLDPPPIKMPHVWPPFTKEEVRKEFLNKSRILEYVFDPYGDTDYKMDNIKWDFIHVLKGGKLLLKKGYRWDGASRGYEDSGVLWPTKRYDLRASLVHDALYDLLRLEYIPHQDIHTNRYRDFADTLYFLFAVEDGHGRVGARSAWKILRGFGATKAGLDPEEDAPWRYHTLPFAMVYTLGNEMVDQDGKKSLTVSCASDKLEIKLLARNSRPIALIPQAGIHHKTLHETTWRWSLDDKELVSVEQNYIGIELDEGKLSTERTVNQLMDKGLKSGIPSIIRLHIDEGRGVEGEDEVEITVHLDTERPVITGITEPITIWIPNHRYETFTIADFVSSVSDNCTALSLDDLVITGVIRDELEDAKGAGHTKNDMVISPDGKSVDLRIERQGKGDGRVYTILIQAVDENGNTRTESFQVKIPHDRKGSAIYDNPA